MPLQKLQFRPGVNRESTTLTNEGGWFESDKVRFRSGSAEKIGGWIADTGLSNASLAPPAGSFWGVCRSLWNWITLSSYNLLGVGTDLKFYIQNGIGGAFNDVTPIRSTTAAGDVTFAATSGSTTLTVTDAAHGAQAGDFVTYSGAVTLGGAITAIVLNKEYQVVAVTSNNVYTITSRANAGLFVIGVTYVIATIGTTDFTAIGAASNTVGVVFVATGVGAGTGTASPRANGSDSGNGGGATVGAYQVTTGSAVYTQSLGWGAGGWGGAVVGAVTTAVSGGTLSSSNTTVTVTSTTGFTASGNILIDLETISYTGVTGTTFTGCTRGVDGVGSGAATTHTNGTTVTQSTAFTGWGSPANVISVSIGTQLRLWSQANFGEDLIFNPRGGGLYYWNTNANPNIFDRGTLLTTGDTPDICNFVMVSDASRFVICFGVNDYGSAAQNPMLVRWSDQENYTSWTPAITNQAGSYTLSNGSTIITARQSRQEILVWTDSALYSMQYLGPPYVWGFQILTDNISIAGPNTAITVNNITYWMGADKFYVYSGRVETLPCTLRSYIYNDINMSQSFQFFSGTNEGFNEVWWYYCSANSDTVDRYVVYNYLERIWYYGTLARSAWYDSPLRTEPMAMTYGNQLVYHETGVDDGTTNPPSPIVAYVQSSDFDIGDGHNFGFVWRIIPDVTFDGSSAIAPALNFTVRPRQFPGSNYGTENDPAVASTLSYANQRTYNVQQFTEQVYVRIRGRQMAFKVSSDTLGTAWQLGVPRLEVRPDGRR